MQLVQTTIKSANVINAPEFFYIISPPRYNIGDIAILKDIAILLVRYGNSLFQTNEYGLTLLSILKNEGKISLEDLLILLPYHLSLKLEEMQQIITILNGFSTRYLSAEQCYEMGNVLYTLNIHKSVKLEEQRERYLSALQFFVFGQGHQNSKTLKHYCYCSLLEVNGMSLDFNLFKLINDNRKVGSFELIREIISRLEKFKEYRGVIDELAILKSIINYENSANENMRKSIDPEKITHSSDDKINPNAKKIESHGEGSTIVGKGKEKVDDDENEEEIPRLNCGPT